MSASTAQIEACQLSEQLYQLRDAATLMYLEVTQKIRELRETMPTVFFDQAQRLANSTQDEALRNLLGGILSMRGRIIADLAKGDAAVVSEMEPMSFKSGAKHKTVGTIAPVTQCGSWSAPVGFGEGCDLRLQTWGATYLLYDQDLSREGVLGDHLLSL